MGRPNNTKTPPKYSPYKRRTPLGIIQRKISVMVSSAVAFSGGLRRSFSKALLSNTESPNFQTLPLELLFHLFDLTSSEDLVSICTVNRANMDNVATYLNSEQFTKRLKRELASTLTADANAQSICSPAAFAQLIRTCHLFQSKENREASNEQLCADFVVKMYNKIGSLKSELYNDYWGALISTLTWDWAQLTFYSFMHNFTDATGIRARVDWFMYTNTPHDKVEELALRRLLRALFLDNIDPQGAANLTGNQGAQEVAFRLSAILRMFAYDETLIHRLMLLLGAPISVSDGAGNNNGGGGGGGAAAANNNNNRNNRLAAGQEFVDYHRVIADPVNDRQSAIDILGTLPYFTGQMLRTNTIAVPQLRWSELEVFNFLEMLTTYPEPWVLRNFASLLVMAPELARVAIYIRALHGDPAEAGNTMFSCIEASLLLDIKPQAIFRDTLNALTSKCSAAACLTVLREAGSTAHNLTLEAIGTDQQNNNNGNGNGNANHNAAAPVDVDEVDILNLKTALETQRQVADLFLAHLHQIDI